MDIRVRSVTGGTYPLSVRGEVSVSSLAQYISLLTGLPPSQLQLFSCARLLREDAPVHISPGDEIQFLTKVRAGVMIYVKTFQGKSITIEVDLDFDTVAVVKNKIEEKIGLSRDQMILVFNNNQLDDDKSLRACNLNREDTIHLVAKGDERASTVAGNTDGPENVPANPPWWKCCLI